MQLPLEQTHISLARFMSEHKHSVASTTDPVSHWLCLGGNTNIYLPLEQTHISLTLLSREHKHSVTSRADPVSLWLYLGGNISIQLPLKQTHYLNGSAQQGTQTFICLQSRHIIFEALLWREQKHLVAPRSDTVFLLLSLGGNTDIQLPLEQTQYFPGSAWEGTLVFSCL